MRILLTLLVGEMAGDDVKVNETGHNVISPRICMFQIQISLHLWLFLKLVTQIRLCNKNSSIALDNTGINVNFNIIFKNFKKV
jgi:hypothetical protein